MVDSSSLVLFLQKNHFDEVFTNDRRHSKIMDIAEMIRKQYNIVSRRKFAQLAKIFSTNKNKERKEGIL